MTDLALAVLHMSLMAALVAVIVLPLRWGARKLRLPAGLCVALWLVVLARMVLPVGMLTSTFSLLRWSSPAVERQVRTVAQAAEALPETEKGSQPVVAEPESPSREIDDKLDLTPKTASVQGPAGEPVFTDPPQPLWAQVLPWLWLAGAVALWVYTAASWLLLRLRLRTAVRRESLGGKVYWESGQVTSPFVFGLFRPKVYVPLGLEGATLDWVLRHEYAHVRLGHHWMKLLFFLALGLHWYDPMLWLAWVLFCRDIEVHCDSAVLKNAPGGQKEYSYALLSLAAPRRGRCSLRALGRPA